MPETETQTLRDTEVFIAGVRLYDTLFHADVEFLVTLPGTVLEAYGQMQEALDRRT